MIPDQFRCLLVDKDPISQDSTATRSTVVSLPRSRLTAAAVTIRVEYSSLNYKDALAFQGHRGVVKTLPHVPGIDAAGVVVASQSHRFKLGDKVIVTGYDLGQGSWGGWSQLISVPEDWVVFQPTNLTSREAMMLGTAGFTAAQSVMALQRNGVEPASGEVVVTGASGGVGSLAVRLLAHLGYNVVAVTGKSEQHDALLKIGAKRVLERREFSDDTPRPMLSAVWAGAIDTVGGGLLSVLLRSTKYGGCVTACGLVAGSQLEMTVYPFLLRGISLCGIASADCPYDKREKLWDLLANSWKPANLSELVTEVELQQIPAQVERILAGKVVGRIVLRLPGISEDALGGAGTDF